MTPPPLLAHVNLARGFRGGERQTALLIAELGRRGYRQRLVARAGEPLLDEVAAPGLERRAAGNVVQAARALAGAQLVHVHQGRSIQPAALASLPRGKPYVVTRRVMSPIRNNPLSRWMYRRAAAIVALSSAVRAELIRYDARLEATVIPSAWTPATVDQERVAAIRADVDGQTLIGHVGALDERSKGQSVLIEVARRLSNCTVMLVGSGPDEAELRAEASDLDNVVFAGQVRDVQNYLAAFDLFAFPSYLEGLGSILLDAMRVGLPIVAHGVGGIPDIVTDDVNGRLIAPGDVDGFTAAVQQIVGDATLSERYSASSRRRAEDYSPAAMATRYERVYETLLGSRQLQGQA